MSDRTDAIPLLAMISDHGKNIEMRTAEASNHFEVPLDVNDILFAGEKLQNAMKEVGELQGDGAYYASGVVTERNGYLVYEGSQNPQFAPDTDKFDAVLRETLSRSGIATSFGQGDGAGGTHDLEQEFDPIVPDVDDERDTKDDDHDQLHGFDLDEDIDDLDDFDIGDD